MKLTVLSLNVWNINPPVEDRQNRIIEYLKIHRPHIVAMQEISPFGSAMQSDWIAAESGYQSAYYQHNGFWNGREEGLAILTCLDSMELEAVSLPLGENDMPRTLQLIKVTQSKNHGSFIVGNTHLAFHINSTHARRRQVQAVLDGLTSATGRVLPVILCGDLNDTPESEAIRILYSDSRFSFQDSWTVAGDESEGHTFAKENKWADSKLWPGRRIDYIAASKEFVVHSCCLVMTSSDSGPVSDHYGIVAELELHNAQN